MIKPIRDMVVVEPIEVTVEKTEGGIYLGNEIEVSPYATGIVKAVGDFPPMVELIKVGDEVIYNRYSALKINVCGSIDTLVQFAAIIGKVEPNTTSVET